MTTSDWITIISISTGLFVTTVGSTLILAFKIGAVHETVTSMGKTLERVTVTLEKITSKRKFRGLN